MESGFELGITYFDTMRNYQLSQKIKILENYEFIHFTNILTLMLDFVAIPNVISLTCGWILCLVYWIPTHLCSRLLQARGDIIHRIGGILGCYWIMRCKRVYANGDSSRKGNGFESLSDTGFTLEVKWASRISHWYNLTRFAITLMSSPLDWRYCSSSFLKELLQFPLHFLWYMLKRFLRLANNNIKW